MGGVTATTGVSLGKTALAIAQQTTVDLINSTKQFPVGTVVSTGGYLEAGDGGKGTWKLTAVTGQTVSQSPAQLGDALLNDASGNQWALVIDGSGIKARSLGAINEGAALDTLPIQAALNACKTSTSKEAILDAGTYLFGQLLVPNGVGLIGVDRDSVFAEIDPAIGVTTPWVTNEDLDNGSPARIANNLRVEGITWDGSNRVAPKWLQNPDTLVAITDPENDYFADGGKIGDPAFGADPNGIVLSVTPGGSGALTLDGVLVSGGSADLSLPAVRPRKVSITSAGNASGTIFTITGTDEFDEVLVSAIDGPNATTVFSAAAFKTVTIVSADSGTGVAIEVGIKEYDIFSVVAEKRRNKRYVDAGVIITFNKVSKGAIRNNRFKNHNGVAIREAGGLDVIIEDNIFDTVGKNDGAFPAISTQSYGTPGAGQVFFQDSDNTIIRKNRAVNLARSFCLFAPTKGGTLEDNVIDGWGESCIFVPGSFLHLNGGKSTIRRNELKNGTLTDIVCNGIEAGNTRDLDIYDNDIVGSASQAMVLTAAKNVRARGNYIKNCFKGGDIPFGPFSERFGFGVGTAPVAGNARAIEDGSVITIGSFEDNGCDKLQIDHNTFVEDRVSFPDFLFNQTKTGVSSISERCDITDNILDIPSTMGMLDVTVASVWTANIPLRMRGNINHPSETSQIINHQFTSGATGLVVFDVGFRPSMVQILAANNTGGAGQSWVGAFTWQADAVRNDTGIATGIDNTSNERILIQDQDAIRIVSASSVTQFTAEFTAWRETGFILNVVTSIATINARIICTP